ncbi:hypothetical protein PN836_014775 [Ningiella sp. W23]|uniref:hypothetical protein n=1 Tax=Ningiella sp. W23 TaxID=3023715 RepID=UPI003756893B
MNTLYKLIAVAFSMYAFSSGATLIDTKSNSFIDTQTNLEWADFHVTSNYSFRDVEAETLPGGKFQGWRLPSANEVFALWNDQFTLFSNSSVTTTGPGEQYREEIWDSTDGIVESSLDPLFDIIGLGDIFVPDIQHVWNFEGFTGLSFIEPAKRPSQDGFFRDAIWYTDAPDWSTEPYFNFRIPTYAVMIVREVQEVAEPESLLVILAGCLSIVYSRRNNQMCKDVVS